MRYFNHLAYNGTPFVGWQIQPNGNSVQAEIQNAISILLKEPIEIVGCGRTDTGVHASSFYAHFDFKTELSDQKKEWLCHKLNGILPKEIVIFSLFNVADDLHARFSALDRTYKYYVNIYKNPFTFPFAYRVHEPLNLQLMNEACEYLKQTEDFTSFSKLHTQVNNNICSVTHAEWNIENDQLVFTITANRFLRNMVRAIVGTLLELGKEKISLDKFQDIINQKDRSKAGKSVPAHALFLENVRYNF